MIELSKLELQNFLSHVSTSLDMSRDSGLVLIEGVTSDGHYSSNGAGKSTLLEGIVYALTGDTLRGVSVNDVINRNYKKNTKVSLQFKKDGTEYLIDRYRKDDKYGDSLSISEAGKDISKRVNKETQKSLDDILNISYKVLVSTVLLGEGLSSRFTQLSDPDKKSLIESTLNMNYDLSAIRAKANTQLSALKLKKSNLEGRIATLKEVSSLDVERARADILKFKKDSNESEEKISSLQSDIINLEGERGKLEQKLELLRNTISEIDSIQAQLKRLDDQNHQYVAELNQMERTESPVCTVCHQHLVSDDSKEAFRQSYAEKINSLTNEMIPLHSRLSNLPDRNLICEKYTILKEDYDSIAQKLASINAMMNEESQKKWEYQSISSSLEKDILSHEESVRTIDSLEKEYEETSYDIEKYDYFYRLFSPTGIIVNILSDAIEYINGRLAVYSEVLLEKNYSINFIKGKISLVDSRGSNYQSLSNGEKRRLDIAIQFSLHDYVHMYCGMKMDCCFIDEILDTLDDIGVENIFEVLRLKLQYCQLKNIYVITHNNSLKDKFDRVITIRKNDKGDSYLVE